MALLTCACLHMFFFSVCASVCECLYAGSEVTVLPQDNNRRPKETPGPHADPVEPLSTELQPHAALQPTDAKGCEQAD